MHVGAHFNSDFPFHGRIRDVKVWQAAVGLEDMQREAAAAASAAVAAHPPLPSLRAHYSLELEAESHLSDSTGNFLGGALVRFT